MTPVDERHTIDRWMHIRNTAINDGAASAKIDELFNIAFAEDKVILEAIQIEEDRPMKRKPIRVAIDKGPNIYRKRIERLVQKEIQN